MGSVIFSMQVCLGIIRYQKCLVYFAWLNIVYVVQYIKILMHLHIMLELFIAMFYDNTYVTCISDAAEGLQNTSGL